MTDSYSFTPEQRDIMNTNHIPYRTAYERITRSGWDVERAITQPIRKPVSSAWDTYKHIALKNGINHSTYWRRWKKGYPPEACLLSKADFDEYCGNQ